MDEEAVSGHRERGSEHAPEDQRAAVAGGARTGRQVTHRWPEWWSGPLVLLVWVPPLSMSGPYCLLALGAIFASRLRLRGGLAGKALAAVALAVFFFVTAFQSYWATEGGFLSPRPDGDMFDLAVCLGYAIDVMVLSVFRLKHKLNIDAPLFGSLLTMLAIVHFELGGGVFPDLWVSVVACGLALGLAVVSFMRDRRGASLAAIAMAVGMTWVLSVNMASSWGYWGYWTMEVS